MKKTIALLLISLLLLSTLLASCGEGEEAEQSIESIQSVPSDAETSKPWYSTSAPDDYSNTIIDNSSDDVESSTDNESSSPDNEQSLPEISQPESSSTSGDTMTYDELDILDRYDFAKSAIGHQIVYTKTSALNATECMTNVTIGITAIYDGSVTRFFDALNGTYYHALYGRYEPCDDNSPDHYCVGGFLGKDYNDTIEFTRISENEVTFVMNDHAGHAFDCSYNALYCEADKKVYAYDFTLYGVKGLTPCRYYEGSVMSCFDGTDFDIDESKLGKYGVASNEKVIIPFEYDLIITAQGNEDVGVYLAIKDGKSYYFSSDGFNLTPDGFDCGSQPFNDRAWVFEDGQGWIIKFN